MGKVWVKKRRRDGKRYMYGSMEKNERKTASGGGGGFFFLFHEAKETQVAMHGRVVARRLMSSSQEGWTNGAAGGRGLFRLWRMREALDLTR